jgi:hypothetical protein
MGLLFHILALKTIKLKAIRVCTASYPIIRISQKQQSATGREEPVAYQIKK